MNPQRFLTALAARFDDFPRSPTPRDPRFAAILEEVGGFATPNTLALLNAAASALDPGESYVEIGTYQGASLLAALLDGDGVDAVAIDRFSMGSSERELRRTLDRHGLDGVATVLAGDAFALVPGGALGERRVGVWYYDAAHDYAAQVEGLRMAEPFLVPGALLVVDDTDWERVARATGDYLAAQPRARLLLDLPGEEHGNPHWWAGMQVLAWEG